MRVGVVCLLVSLLGATGGQAQDILEDAEGDVQFAANGGNMTAVPAGVKDAIDLRFLRIVETPDTLDFRVGLTALSDTGDEVAADRYITISARHHDMVYRIVHFNQLLNSDGAALYVEDPANLSGFTYLGNIPVVYHVDDTAYGYEVPRDQLLDSQGAPPFEGRLIDGIHAQALSPYLVSTLASVFPAAVTGQGHLFMLADYMGEETAGTYLVQQGGATGKEARITSPEPYRYSNGEASTFVYWVDATNRATETRTYTLSAKSVPSGWTVQVPGQPFDIQSEATVSFPIVLETVFSHAHGSTTIFEIVLDDQGSADEATVELGIHYPEVPQPAGHHNLLRLWSLDDASDVMETLTKPAHQIVFGNGGTEIAYMNAAAEDDYDIGAPVDFTYCGGGSLSDVVTGNDGQEPHCLRIDLQPGLRMGLDFKPDQDGHLSIQIDTPIPLEDVAVSGRLLHRLPVVQELAPGFTQTTYEEVELGLIAATEPESWSANQVTKLELPIDITEAADYIPYSVHAGLRLELWVHNLGPADGVITGEDLEPRLLKGGTMELPLNEYRDVAVDLPVFEQGLSWQAAQTDRATNPGKTVLFAANLTTDIADTFDVRLVGVNQAWAELIGPATLNIGANESQSYTVAVRIPAGATIDDRADLVLEAASQTDVGRRALIQLHASVLVNEEVPDEEHLIPDGAHKKKSPGIGLLALFGAVGVAVRAKRS